MDLKLHKMLRLCAFLLTEMCRHIFPLSQDPFKGPAPSPSKTAPEGKASAGSVLSPWRMEAAANTLPHSRLAFSASAAIIVPESRRRKPNATVSARARTGICTRHIKLSLTVAFTIDSLNSEGSRVTIPLLLQACMLRTRPRCCAGSFAALCNVTHFHFPTVRKVHLPLAQSNVPSTESSPSALLLS